MVISVAERGGLVVLSGRLDVSTVHEARWAVHEAVDAGSGDLVVDLQDVELLDATGLGMLVGAHRRARRAGRRLVLRNLSPQLTRLLRVSRLDRVLLVERPSIPSPRPEQL